MSSEKKRSNRKQLLFTVSIKDCKVEEIASTGGGGGQNKNRRHTAIRITHPPSGAVGYSADQRDQYQNKVTAFIRMAKSDKFTSWNLIRACELLATESIDERVENAMRPELLKVEHRPEGKWTTWSDWQTEVEDEHPEPDQNENDSD